MAYWCETYITINCKNEESAKCVYDSIESWSQKLIVESDWGGNWLGNILINAGVYHTKDELLDDKNLRCRGYIQNLQLDDCSVIIQTETVEHPMMKMWKEIVDKVFPKEVEDVLYTATEINAKLFWTNDPAYKGAWYYEYNGEHDFCASEDEAKQYLLDHVNGEIKDYQKYSVEELESKIKEIDKANTGIVDSWFLVLYELFEYEFVPIESEAMH